MPRQATNDNVITFLVDGTAHYERSEYPYCFHLQREVDTD